MKLALLLGLAVIAQAQDPDAALRKQRSAGDALQSCLDTGAKCEVERLAYRLSSDEANRVINQAIRTDLRPLHSAIADLSSIVTALERQAACKQSRRWWQLWKHCPI